MNASTGQLARNRLLPGQPVRIKPLGAILATLDNEGKLEGLPFMPEMAKYCGKVYYISKRIERTCEESEGGMRRIKNVVFLDELRCDGGSHGGCQKRCNIFWKVNWLSTDLNAANNEVDRDCEVDPVVLGLRSRLDDGSYVCQSTELINATSPLRTYDFGSYIRDLRARTYRARDLIKLVSQAFFLRFRYYVRGTPYRFLQGSQGATPSQTLNLQPGEWVTVKTKEEILETLDTNGMNRGLRFTLDMLECCGKSYRVLSRLDKMIHEPSREIIELKDTVILEDSICVGCHIIRGGCPRGNYNFWREVWLRRAR